MPERVQLGPLTLLGQGGQGAVYHAPRARISYAAAVAYKEYKPAERAKVDFGALEAMTAFLGARTFDEGSRLVERVAWPAQVVTERGSPVGFLMAEVPADFGISLALPSGARQQALATIQLLLNPGAYLARRGIGCSERDRYLLLVSIAETLALLHGHGIAVGDLSPKNILFALAPGPHCFFVDADAMRLAGRSALPQAETPDWEIHLVSGEELATPRSDAYKFGLLALRLLAGDQSTRDPARLPASVPAAVRKLVTGSLAPTPGARPALAEWAGPLRMAAAGASSALPVKPAVPTARPAPPRPTAAPVVATPAPAFSTRPSQPAPVPADRPRRWPWAVVAVAVAGGLILAANPGLLHSAAATPVPTIPASGAEAAKATDSRPNPTVTTDVDGLIRAFVSDYVAAERTGDFASILARLNSAVIDRYGAPACQALSLSWKADPTYAMEISTISGPAAWDYVSDGLTTTVKEAWTVALDETSGGSTTRVALHLALADGGITWFTDCGDPV